MPGGWYDIGSREQLEEADAGLLVTELTRTRHCLRRSVGHRARSALPAALPDLQPAGSTALRGVPAALRRIPPPSASAAARRRRGPVVAAASAPDAGSRSPRARAAVIYDARCGGCRGLEGARAARPRDRARRTSSSRRRPGRRSTRSRSCRPTATAACRAATTQPRGLAARARQSGGSCPADPLLRRTRPPAAARAALAERRRERSRCVCRAEPRPARGSASSTTSTRAVQRRTPLRPRCARAARDSVAVVTFARAVP